MEETMRDKLINLLNTELKKHFNYVPLDTVIKVADSLLEHNVFVGEVYDQ